MYVPRPSGGSPAWGGITGSLPDQSDLVAALSLYLPVHSVAGTGDAMLNALNLMRGSYTLSNPTGTVGDSFLVVVPEGVTATINGVNFDGPCLVTNSFFGSGWSASREMFRGSGWGGNVDAGTKGLSIQSTSDLDIIASSLELLSPGAGTALRAVCEKFKALQADLYAGRLPSIGVTV